MNLWDGRIIRLTLSAAGRTALAAYFEAEFVEVEVWESDASGLWVVLDAVSDDHVTLVLIRWDYVAIAEQDVQVDVPESKPNVVGFRLIK